MALILCRSIGYVVSPLAILNALSTAGDEFNLTDEQGHVTSGWRTEMDLIHALDGDCNVTCDDSWYDIIDLAAHGLIERVTFGEAPGSWICHKHGVVGSRAVRITITGYRAVCDMRMSDRTSITIELPETVA
jgi:hypothetical protein